MISIKILTSDTKAYFKEKTLWILEKISHLRGLRCLSPAETSQYCSALGVKITPGKETIFKKGNGIKELSILSCGIGRINKYIIFTDFGNREALLDFKHTKIHYDHAVALWSHKWLGFYHFLAEVAPKICLLQENYGKSLDGIMLCYPKINKQYEREILSLLEVPEEKIHDTLLSGPVTTDCLSVVPMPGWFKVPPNIDLLRRRLLREPKKHSGGSFLYLKRSGRRKCINEVDYLPELIEMGYQLVDENPRSISDQITLFRDAKVIIGPHGSAFTNMIWAPPGARIIEMVPTGFDVSYHSSLSAACCHDYKKLSCNNGRQSTNAVFVDFIADASSVIKFARDALLFNSSH